MIDKTMEQVVAAAQAIPLKKDLIIIIEDSVRASVRSYYLPDEDERLRTTFAHYLLARNTLLEALESIMPLLNEKQILRNELRSFATGYTAGCMLIRSTKFIIELAQQHPVIWNKLDESEQRFGLKRKTISHLFESLSSPKKMWQFHQATRFFEKSKPEIMALDKLSNIDHELIQLLQQELPFIESRKRDYLKRRIRYRLYDIIRRNSSGYKKAMFHLFRLTGSAVAELKQPMKNSNKSHKGSKRVTPEILKEISHQLNPGDILITRHDDALSNLFLPGYWPHAALYTGEPSQLKKQSLNTPTPAEHQIIESKKDGVKFRSLTETLRVDSFIVIRPVLAPSSLSKVIEAAISHVGKRYDFLFDFTKSDRLACTELIYRSYHGIDDLAFSLTPRSGRMCISAEDLINQMMRSGKFQVHAIFSEETKVIIYGDEAHQALKLSYKSQW